MESLAATILNSLHIDSVNARLGINTNSKQLEALGITNPNCCIIDSFLIDEADVTISLTHHNWVKAKNTDEQKSISICFYKMFTIFSDLMGITEADLEAMKTQYIRMVFGDCIIDNEDRRLKNIEAIYNERTFSYRLAPAFDNALAFNAFNIGDTDGFCFIGNQEFPVTSIINYIINHHYSEVADIIENLEYLQAGGLEAILSQYKDEITSDKAMFICDYITNINEKVYESKQLDSQRKR